MAAPVRHIAGVYRFGINADGAYAVKRLLHRHILFKVYILGGHNTARAVVGISQKLIYHLALGRTRLTENTLCHGCGHFVDNVNRIVHKQLVHYLFKLGIAERLNKELLHIGVHFNENFRRKLFREYAENNGQFLFGNLLKYHRNVGRVHLR